MVQQTYFFKVQVLPDMPHILEKIRVDVIRPQLLLTWKVDILDLHHIVFDSSQKDPKQLRISHPIHRSGLDNYLSHVGVLLGSNGQSGSHAGVTLRLRIR